LPCYEIDKSATLYSSAISRTFYDAQGRVVETRTSGPTPGDDTVVATVYKDEAGSIWKSVPFQVADGSGWIDPSTAKDINGNTPAGTVTFIDALGRTIATQDLNYGSSQEPGLACLWGSSQTYTSCVDFGLASPIGDSATYDWTTTIDANNHVSESFTDVVGQVRYVQVKSGVATGTVAVVKQTATQYNALGKPTSVVVTDEQPQSGEGVASVTTTMTYDDTGRLLTAIDPDQGTLTYSYDPDGHALSIVQTSGSSSRTLGYNYDLLGRLGCEQTAAPTINATGACSAGNPLVQNTYDTTILGVQGTSDFPVGQLTQSVATTYYADGTSAKVTEQFQHDQRLRLTNEQMQLALPTGWGVTASLPSYQEAISYNDADQPTTTSAMAGSASYTFTAIYDTGNGVLQGLSNNSISLANLATLSYNEYTQLASITLLNGASSSPASIATTQFGYDADQRPNNLTATWLPGSSNSGQILGQARTYDNAGNVTGVTTNFASVPGQSGSGGAETQNFCYDEQNQLIWAGNSGAQPGTGSGTCGSGTLANTLSGAGYTTGYAYTHLEQIWQGPLNGQGASEQYLYCNSNASHQLTGIYPIGTTCANRGSATALYSASYDAWGNETGRTYNGTTATLSYDVLNHLTEYSAGSNNQEFYVYDANGDRVFKRSTSAGTTNLTAYAFGLQEISYTASGVLSGQTDYYSLDGHLIGSTNGETTTYDLTDTEGSVLMSLSSNAVLGEQIYGPYGNQRYVEGTLGTDKGYTGQFYDGVSGLDYYVARYFDPVIGSFLSPDDVEGNMQGANPYAYAMENPETRTDPTGHDSGTGVQNPLEQAIEDIYNTAQQAWESWNPVEETVATVVCTLICFTLITIYIVLVVVLLTIPSDSAYPTSQTTTSGKKPQQSKPPQKGHASPATTPTPGATPATQAQPAASGSGKKGGGYGGCTPSQAWNSYNAGGGHIADHLFYNQKIEQKHFDQGNAYSSFFSEETGRGAIKEALSRPGTRDPQTGRWTFRWKSTTALGDVATARRLDTGDWKIDTTAVFIVKVIFTPDCKPITAFITNYL
jgi:RHS repeat-associated protein